MLCVLKPFTRRRFVIIVWLSLFQPLHILDLNLAGMGVRIEAHHVGAAVRTRSCSKCWRDNLVITLQAWANQNGNSAPRSARARHVPKQEAALAQQLRNFRKSYSKLGLMPHDEITVWKSLAPIVWPDAKAPDIAEWVAETYDNACEWLKHNSFLLTSKKGSTNEANALVKRLLRIRRQWCSVPETYRSQFMEMPGWPRDGTPSKQHGTRAGRPPQKRPAACGVNQTGVDSETELHGLTDDIDEAHPDRSAITRPVTHDYRIYLPHKRPGLLTTSFSDIHECLTKLLSNAECVAKRKRAAGAARVSSTAAMKLADGADPNRTAIMMASAAVAAIPMPQCGHADAPCVADGDSTDPGMSTAHPIAHIAVRARAQPYKNIGARHGNIGNQAAARRRFVRPHFVSHVMHRKPMDVL